MRVLTLLLLACAAYAAKKSLTVIVEETKIRKSKAHFSGAVAALKFGDRVSPTGNAEDGWIPVEHDGSEGWIHESAVSAKKVKAGSARWTGSDESTAEEVTLAGKGFNEKVEKAYREEHADLDFGLVDAMEKREISEKALRKFMLAGDLLPHEEVR